MAKTRRKFTREFKQEVLLEVDAGEARLIAAGSEIILQMHYHPRGTPERIARASGSSLPKGRCSNSAAPRAS